MRTRSLTTAAALLGTVLTLGLASLDAPVADAAMGGDIDLVRMLLKRGVDVNAAQGDGMTALHWAARSGNEELARILIYAGANLAAATRLGGYTPLLMAAGGGRARVVEVLLGAGASPQAKTTSGGATPLHLAASSGSVAAVDALLGHGARIDALEERWGQTPLMFATSRGRLDVTKKLIAAGADMTITTQVADLPALAAERRVGGKVREQVLASFRGDEPEGTSWQPMPAQVQAAVRAANDPPAGAGANIPDKLDDFEFPIDQDLGTLGAPPAQGTVPDQGSETLAATAAQPADPDEPASADAYNASYPNLVGAHGGLTALLHSVREGHADTALALIDAGADIDQPSAGDHTTPLLMATINGHFDLAMTLLELGADPNIASDAGATPLFTAINAQWAPKARYPQQQAYLQQQTTYLELMSVLLAAGADPNVRLTKHLWYMEYTFTHLEIDTRGATPFWRAAHALDVEVMRLLVEYGAEPDTPTRKAPKRRFNAPDEEEEPTEDPSGLALVAVGGPAVWPIHATSGHGYGTGFAGNSHRHVPDGWMPAMRYLVGELGADVNARDHEGFSPLHNAAARGDNEMILFLVERGADVTVVNRAGQTTADMANGPQQRTQAFSETVALLERLGSKNNDNCVSC